MDNAELSRGLNQSCLRLQDGRESLIEIGRYLAEISARRAAPASPKRHGFDVTSAIACVTSACATDRAACRRSYSSLAYRSRRQQFLRPGEFNLRELQCGLAFFKGGNAGMQQGDLVVDVLHGVLQLPA